MSPGHAMAGPHHHDVCVRETDPAPGRRETAAVFVWGPAPSERRRLVRWPTTGGAQPQACHAARLYSCWMCALLSPREDNERPPRERERERKRRPPQWSIVWKVWENLCAC
jgi:hypothetical protein